ncbi:MAG: bacteriohemerythrin [Campylobacter sp.]|uniref:bacteriohemerythrin n=1 Tax=Campylobacter sp. TaxID=205 RepID=UPI002AA61209|nr:bacteriohemerythrin [Campylobacter sp.]MCI7247347.1 bacteriohemerythrin [Campylobacter sp.]
MMPDWDEKYCIGSAVVDDEHKRLFELAKKAYIYASKNVSKEQMKEIVTEFFNYMKEHFAHEEEYMKSIGYPALPAHAKIHKEIIHSMSDLITKIKNVNEMKENLVTIAKSWLLEHIIQQDMKIEEWHRKNKDVNVVEYDYVCGCPGRVHKISHAIHLKIVDEGKNFKCTACDQVIKQK